MTNKLADRKNLEGRTLDLKTQNPILKLNSATDYMHFFDEEDRGNVQALFNHYNSRKASIYISGSAVVSSITQGIRNYEDIDMLIVAPEKHISTFVQRLLDSKLKTAEELMKSAKVKHNFYFNAGYNNFQTVPMSSQDKKVYMSGFVAERFMLIPITPISEFRDAPLGRSMIDLSLMSDKLFAQSYK